MRQRNLADADRARSAPRHKIFVPTEILFGNGEIRAHLINVSLSGALAHAAPPPPSGETVRIGICGTMVSARVRWTDGPRFGLAFAQPLSPTLLQRLLGDA
jgi:hypothetical protein